MVSVETAQKALKEGWNKTTINKAVAHQNRLKFHVETSMTARYEQPLNDFFAFVSNLIPHDKFKIFKTLFRYPVKTNEVTGICYDKLSRIFDGRNPVFNYQFQTAESKEDWEWYRQQMLHEPEVWKTVGWEHFKTEPNSVLIVDVPRLQTTDRPEPYFYWLPIGDVLAYEKGVESFQINPVTKSVIVTFKEKKTSQEKIEKALAKSGFETPNFEANKRMIEKLPTCCKNTAKGLESNCSHSHGHSHGTDCGHNHGEHQHDHSNCGHDHGKHQHDHSNCGHDHSK